MPNPNLKCSEKFRRGTMAFKECRIKEKQALKALKEKGKSRTKMTRAKTAAEKSEILKKKKDDRAKRVSGVAKSLRTKSVNVKGDRRLRGDNVKTDISKTKIDNRKTTTTAMGGAGGRATGGSARGGRADAGSSSNPRVNVSQQQKKKKKTTVNPPRPRSRRPRMSRYN